VRSLSFWNANLIVGLRSPTRLAQDMACPYAAFTASSTTTLTCYGYSVPRWAGNYTVSLHDIGGDVKNDGDGFKVLSPVQFTFAL
jgi:hypothetical protein